MHVATFHEVFTDVAKASVANTDQSTSGKAHRLALSDPDSSAIVPAFATRFAGDYVLDSQGDDGRSSLTTPARPTSAFGIEAPSLRRPLHG